MSATGFQGSLGIGLTGNDLAKSVAFREGFDADPADFPWGGRGFSVTDPDGFALTFVRR